MSVLRSATASMLAVVLMAMLPVIAIIGYSVWEYREYRLDLSTEEAWDITRATAFNRQAEIENTRTLLLTIAHMHSVQRKEARAIGMLFRTILSQTPFYTRLALFDPDGKLIAAAPSHAYSHGIDDLDSLHSKLQMQRLYIGFGGYDADTGAPTLEFFYPVYGQDGLLKGIIVGGMRTDRGIPSISALTVPKEARIEFHDRIGKVLFSYPEEDPNPEDRAVQSVHVRSRPDSEGIFSLALPSGSRRAVVYKRLFLHDDPDSYMTVLFSIRECALHEEADQSAAGILALLSLSFIPVLLALYFIGRRTIVGRIKTLLATAQRLAGGDLSARTALPSVKGDLGALVHTFDTMAESLEARDMELLRARRASDEYNAAKDQFLAAMSHAIRTPMNSIIGVAYLLLKTPLTDKQQDYLRRIYAAGTTLLGIINDILDYSNIQSGTFSIDRVPFSIRRVMDDIMALYVQKAEESGTLLSAVVEASVPDSLIGDPGRLGQVLTNLVGNALKFTEKGEVLLLCQNAQGACLAEMPPSAIALQIIVHDTGIGMNDEQQERLFTAFSQADDTINRRYGGTGLGLTITKRLVKLMGGSIILGSKEGDGTKIVVCLPFAEDDAALELGGNEDIPAAGHSAAHRGEDRERQSSSSEARRILAGKRVLLVEDNLVNQEIVAELLSDAGAQVTVAANGRIALRYLPPNVGTPPFDVVLMDVHMPEMDGYEATQRIRSMPCYDALPIIAMTAHAMVEEVERSFSVGMNAHISKPIDLVRFFDVLKDALK